MSTRPLPAVRVIPLHNGDRLTRTQFELRYRAMPEVKRAELIEGEVYMPSPVRWEYHGTPQTDLVTWAGVYKAHTPGVDVGDNSTVRLDVDNEPQPDLTVIVRPECGGRAALDDDDYLSGSPDLIAEIAASTTSIDLGKKRNVYRRNQVAEYVVWRVYEEAIDWFVYRDGQFDPSPRTPTGC